MSGLRDQRGEYIDYAIDGLFGRKHAQAHTNGGTGYHKGITKLKDGSYVIIRGTQWQGERDYGYIVSPEEALQEILKSDNLELLKTKKFKSLNELYEKTMIEEEDEDLIEEEV